MARRAAPLARLLPIIGLLTTPLGAEAATEPAASLEKTRAELAASQQRYADLKKDASTLRGEMERLQGRLVSIADEVQGRETRLVELEEKRAILQARIVKNEADLTARQAQTGRLLQSLIRLQRMPPEAVVAMPGPIRRTMQVAMLLTDTTAALQSQAKELRVALITQRRDEQTLAQTKDRLDSELAGLAESRKSLDSDIARREGLQAALDKKTGTEKSRIGNLIRESKSLQQLVAKLETEHARQEKQAKREQVLALPRAKPAATEPETQIASLPEARLPVNRPQPTAGFARGSLAQPVAGPIAVRYGQKNRQGDPNRGVTFRAPDNATVVAPSAGEVMFTGPFMDYGRMVIIRHDGKYLTLLAGMAEVQCTTGQKILAGEPVGRMGAGNPSSTDLYMELRQRSRPIDPGPWLRRS